MSSKKRLIPFLLVLCLLAGQFTAVALEVKQTYQYDENEASISAPEAYNVSAVYYGNSFGAGYLSSASDLFVDSDNQIYIADSGNQRILILNDKFQKKSEIHEVKSPDGINTLSNPQGIFKAKDGLLYICDTGNSRVIAVDDQLKVVRLIDGAGIVAINENMTFKPEKVVADDDGNVFVVSSAVYQGIMRFDKQNSFKSFFAPNEVQTTVDVLMLSMWKKLFSSEQKDMISKTLPTPYNNLIIDNEGFIYATSSQSEAGQEVKRLNATGSNILKTSMMKSDGNIFGDYEITVKENKSVTNSFVDVHVDTDGILSVIDSKSNKVFQYDRECNAIAVFGGTGERKGNFKAIVAIEKLNNNYLVLDRDKGCITVFSPTEYILEVRNALKDYHEGRYLESEDSWKNILQQNSNFLIAYRSIGRAALQQNRYQEAMQMLKRGNDKYFYSLTLKEYRKEFTRRYFLVLLFGTIAVISAFVWLCRWIHKKLLS